MPHIATSVLVEAGDVHLHAVVADPLEPAPDARTFLLVHGLASNAQLWNGMSADLAARGHRVVAVDQRGHGLSSKVDGFDFATLTEDLVAVVDALALGRPVVVGQSWGANVALELAVRHPDVVSALVCIDGGHIELSASFPDRDAMLAALTPPPLDGRRLADLEAGLRRRSGHWPESGIRGQLANFVRRPDGTVAPHLTLPRHLAILDHLWTHHPARRWPQVTADSLLLPVGGGAHGDQDKQRSVAAVADAHPGLRVTWLEGDHDVHAERPHDVAQVVVDFLREVTPPA